MLAEIDLEVWRTGLKIGDRVAWTGRCGEYKVGTVSHFLYNGAVVDVAVGGNHWHTVVRSLLVPPVRQDEVGDRCAALELIQCADWDSLSTGTLELIAGALKAELDGRTR